MQVDDAHDIDVVMPIYNLIKYGDNYSKKSQILRQYWRDDDTIPNFSEANATTDSFKTKKITSE